MNRIECNILESIENSLCEIKQMFDTFAKRTSGISTSKSDLDNLFDRMSRYVKQQQNFSINNNSLDFTDAELAQKDEFQDNKINLKREELEGVESKYTEKLNKLQDLQMVQNTAESLYKKN